MGKYKILMTYVEAGMGHITSAEAIANALETYHPDEVEVIRCRIFTETNDPLLIKHQQFLIDEVKRSNRHPFHMFYLKLLDLPLFPRLFSLRFAFGTLFVKETHRAQAIMRKYDPDMVFNTHFSPLHFAIEENKRRKGCHFLTGLYIPDPNVHGWWDRRADLTFVNNPFAYREAVGRMQFDPQKTELGKFLIRTALRESPKDKKILREKHGLPVDRFTVTLAAGAYAECHLREFADHLLTIDRPYTLLLIAGDNDEIYREFSEKASKTGQIDLRVCKFLPDAHEYYGASDLFITKAGPNSILDSVYMGTPVITNFCASLIEQITKDYFIGEHGVGVHSGSPEEVCKLVTKAIDDPEILTPYQKKCADFVENCVGGEKEVADRILDALRKNGSPKADRISRNAPGKKETKPIR